jgi:endonuclease III-like uncharacterized protein
MATRRARKLEIKFDLSPEVAEALFAAGFTGTTKVRQASRADLLKVKGVGPATADRLQGK